MFDLALRHVVRALLVIALVWRIGFAIAVAEPPKTDGSKPTDTDVTVNVRILQASNEPVTIDYDMEKRPGGWKVWDVRVGGISLVANYRTEFDNLIRESGVEGLIKALNAKNNSQAQPAVAGALKK